MQEFFWLAMFKTVNPEITFARREPIALLFLLLLAEGEAREGGSRVCNYRESAVVVVVVVRSFISRAKNGKRTL
jgi:hypothetical protein